VGGWFGLEKKNTHTFEKKTLRNDVSWWFVRNKKAPAGYKVMLIGWI